MALKKTLWLYFADTLYQEKKTAVFSDKECNNMAHRGISLEREFN